MVNVTRGFGLLEGFLSRKRAKMANKLINPAERRGRIMDIGCGSFPYFLESTEFESKIGLDKMVTDEQIRQFDAKNITLIRHDVTLDQPLPFSEEDFNVITMLAVFEHIEPTVLQELITEIHRVLRSKGEYILTTPAGWADPILRTMAKLHLVSPEEIDEHQDKYTLKMIQGFLLKAGFKKENISTGTFELGMNLWAKATKEG
ncbi:hypothetical protein COU78_00755 [Candidatus Peregrinibacteria bacterium CG10_big_fil_rev_8_21_14_0_10_49_24]|nr:MAG: hypothetical protein COV83_01005 [Candidatus Peregrinibacteria bacterium CG11_big_fil_rev_8_21_14_0_20_49_14]PIR51482.1 MAG: hypothetical protein COU78_00755 [Candidatus Peregrinibacteria bacterium CG10_big_fil_rev_8_21_14_0_10_49_24]PJA67875.1 MAG: hypothetical protein CO157_02585 [Candidatus Peregrinibacteria bacterium CG_4_9_14_3_um_filter_49_12]